MFGKMPGIGGAFLSNANLCSPIGFFRAHSCHENAEILWFAREWPVEEKGKRTKKNGFPNQNGFPKKNNGILQNICTLSMVHGLHGHQEIHTIHRLQSLKSMESKESKESSEAMEPKKFKKAGSSMVHGSLFIYGPFIVHGSSNAWKPSK